MGCCTSLWNGGDLILEHVNAQEWGYVVAGYFLIESAVKAILLVRELDVPKTHSLSGLFKRLKDPDKGILREC